MTITYSNNGSTDQTQFREFKLSGRFSNRSFLFLSTEAGNVRQIANH